MFFYFAVTLPEEASGKLAKLKLVDRSLEYQSKFNSTLANIDKNMGELRKDFEREYPEIAGLPDNIKNENLHEKALMIFEKLEGTVNSSNVEDCHQLLGNGNKRFIIKLSIYKDDNKIRGIKKS